MKHTDAQVTGPADQNRAKASAGRSVGESETKAVNPQHKHTPKLISALETIEHMPIHRARGAKSLLLHTHTHTHIPLSLSVYISFKQVVTLGVTKNVAIPLSACSYVNQNPGARKNIH